MIAHYLKIGFRNLLKYRQQTIVSVLGLAVGLVCFVLSLFWIQYERGYDSFIPHRNQIFSVSVRYPTLPFQFSGVPVMVAERLKNEIPEIVDMTEYPIRNHAEIDSAFFRMIPVTPLVGDYNRLFKTVDGIVLTRSVAMKAYGRLEVIGEIFEQGNREYHVCAVVEDWPKHANSSFLTFCRIQREKNPMGWDSMVSLFIKISSHATLNTVKEKIEKLSFENVDIEITLTPLGDLHFERMEVKYSYVQLLAIMGILIILCALINFIVLFFSRLRMRGKELLLRKVNGASNFSLLAQLITEVGVILLIAFLIGAAAMEWILPYFGEVAQIELAKSDLFNQVIGYVGVTLLTLLVIIAFSIGYYRKRLFMQYLRVSQLKINRYLFRSFGLAVQLIISIGLLFCMTVFLWQIYHLTYNYLGYDRTRICLLLSRSQNAEAAPLLASEVEAIPEIEKFTTGDSFFPTLNFSMWEARDTDQPKTDSKKMTGRMLRISPDYTDVLNIEILSGEVRCTDSPRSCLISETAAREFSLDLDRNNTYYGPDGNLYQVTAIVRDMNINGPLSPIPSLFFIISPPDENLLNWSCLICKYTDGKKKEVETKLKELYEKHDLDMSNCDFYYMEEDYNSRFKSEYILLALLSLISGVCILISLFGIYSMVSLTNEQRRKEMAIRKINGASVWTIHVLFVREYIVITAIASLFAFPTGFLIMQPWLERYSNRIEMGWPIFLILWFLVSAAVTLTVLSRVWKTAHMNPTQELKKE